MLSYIFKLFQLNMKRALDQIYSHDTTKLRVVEVEIKHGSTGNICWATLPRIRAACGSSQNTHRPGPYVYVA